MKKLMIAAAIVCTAAMSHAAEYNWNVSLTGVYDSSDVSAGGILNSGLATYIFDANVMESSVLAGYLAAGELSYLDDALRGPVAGGGYGGINEYGGPNNGNTKGIIGGADDKALAYVVIFNAETAAAADKFWISTNGEGAIDETVKGGGNATISLGIQTTNSGADWQAIAVPEPTSGLLLLLGVAGLALRRRRA